MEDETVDTHSLITRHTHCINQVLLITEGAECRKKPAVSIHALANITRSGVIFEESGLLEYVGHAFDRSWGISFVVGRRLQTIQTVSPTSFEIEFNIEMRVTIFSIDPSAFSCDFRHR